MLCLARFCVMQMPLAKGRKRANGKELLALNVMQERKTTDIHRDVHMDIHGDAHRDA